MDAQETISSIHFSDLFQQKKEKKQDLVRIGENQLKVDVVYNFHRSVLPDALKHAIPKKVKTHRFSRVSSIIQT